MKLLNFLSVTNKGLFKLLVGRKVVRMRRKKKRRQGKEEVYIYYRVSE